MKIGIHIDLTLFPIPAYSIPVPLLYTVIEMILFFGCQQYSFAVVLSLRIVVILHDFAYGVTNSVYAGSIRQYEYCLGSNSTYIEQYCRQDYCYYDCKYDDYYYPCDDCVENCAKRCTYKSAMIASSVLFFLNFMVGIATVLVFARLPKDPCCYCCFPNYPQQPYPVQVIQPGSVTVSKDCLILCLSNIKSSTLQVVNPAYQMVQLPNGQQVVVQQQGLHPQPSTIAAVTTTPTQQVPSASSSAGPTEASALSKM